MLLRAVALCVIASGCIDAAENVDLSVIQQIRSTEREHSNLSETLFYLTDLNGPRLTNTPSFFSAAEWVVKQMSALGINAKKEKWGPFGKSWRYEKYYAAMVEPQYMPLIGFPLAWSGSTEGPATGDATIAPVSSDADIEKYRGKLKGKIILSKASRDLGLSANPVATRWTAPELEDLQKFSEALPPPSTRTEILAARKKANDFYKSEGVMAILSYSPVGNDGTVFGSSAGDREANDPTPPSIVLTPEHYNRMYRLLSHGIPVKVNLDVKTELVAAEDAVNVVAEIPGGSRKDQVVMLGAHLDSWQGGTGATDNAAGSAVMIEVMRLLKTLHLKTDRTVRLALWSGEEEGMLGSKAYVKEHFADPETMKLTGEHAKLDAYFNLDNGSGRIRGIYLQGNDMCRPIFEAWLSPFADMDANTVTIRDTGGTDHLSFDEVGLPGFEFIQDRLEYGSLTHHSNMDVYDHVLPGDLKQAATIVASFVYLAANRPEMLPRKPLPPPHPATK